MRYYLITSDFFADWELVTAPNQKTVDNYILSSGNIDNDITVVCSSEDMDFRDDLSEYDYAIVYLSDYNVE